MRVAVNALFNRRLRDRVTQRLGRRQSIYFCVSLSFFLLLGATHKECAVPFFVFKSIMKGKQPKMTELENKTATPPRMMTIRQVAQTGVLPEHALRQMEKQKMLPCFYVGKKCLINYDKLIEQLQQL